MVLLPTLLYACEWHQSNFGERENTDALTIKTLLTLGTITPLPSSPCSSKFLFQLIINILSLSVLYSTSSFGSVSTPLAKIVTSDVMLPHVIFSKGLMVTASWANCRMILPSSIYFDLLTQSITSTMAASILVSLVRLQLAA